MTWRDLRAKLESWCKHIHNATIRCFLICSFLTLVIFVVFILLLKRKPTAHIKINLNASISSMDSIGMWANSSFYIQMKNGKKNFTARRKYIRSLKYWILGTLSLTLSLGGLREAHSSGVHVVHVVNRCRIRLVSQQVSVFQDFRNGLHWSWLGTLHFPALILMTPHTIPSSSEHMYLDSLFMVWGLPVILVCLALRRVSWEWWPLSCSAPGLWDLPLRWF